MSVPALCTFPMLSKMQSQSHFWDLYLKGTYFGITHFLYFWYLRVKSSDWLFIFRFDQPDFDEFILEEMRYDHYQFALAPLMVLFGTNTCRCRLFSLVLKAMEEDRSRSVKDSLNFSKESLHLARWDTSKSKIEKNRIEQHASFLIRLFLMHYWSDLEALYHLLLLFDDLCLEWDLFLGTGCIWGVGLLHDSRCGH